MNSFIKSMKEKKSNDRNSIIKKAITTQLSESVKEIQLCGVEENILSDLLDVEEATNSLCSVIEAMFLHGLKDSLAHRFRRVIADVDERPEPSFWAPLLVISHRQIIDQIVNSSQITTEVGQCRSWIRLALNDCLLSSYLLTLRQDTSTLKNYYNVFAYVRDSDLLEVAQKLIEGIEAIKAFTLPCYSSILNSWPQSTLILAGIWSPALRACPVQACVDVAQSSQPASIENSESASMGSMLSLNSRNSTIGHILELNENEALKLILTKHHAEQVLNYNSTEQSISEASDADTTSIENETGNFQVESNLGNSLNRRTGWSFDENQNGEVNAEKDECIPPEMTKSSDYTTLIESYNLFGGEYIRTPDLREVWQRFENRSNGEQDQTEQINDNNKDEIANIDDINSLVFDRDSIPFAVQIGKLAKEKGLDAQNYECAGCRAPIGITYRPRVCAFTGEYYCNDCMSKEMKVIPARIIHNWDFDLYEISQKAFNCLEEVKDHPMIDLKILNPYIYMAVEEMAALQILRNQLNFLRAYLYTCREPIIEQLQKHLWPREYLYEHIHLYSVSDLCQIPNGALAEQLKDVVDFGKKHVFHCWGCSQKGFLCEICNKWKVLFPFDVENVYRCDKCNAVYHIGCLNSSKPCPKCERKKKREDVPLLGVTMS